MVHTHPPEIVLASDCRIGNRGKSNLKGRPISGVLGTADSCIIIGQASGAASADRIGKGAGILTGSRARHSGI